MSTELIITQGSNAGSEAPIHAGYYLVGRSKECQIRPKSRSVSRRHCLLLRNDDGFGALDLKSASGTFVNGARIESHTWKVLHHGDELRFGKVVFTVSIQEPALIATSHPSPQIASDSLPEDQDTPTPESWQNFDVAEFLDAEDAEEWQNRYGRLDADIKENVPSGPGDNADIDLSRYVDTPLEKSIHDTVIETSDDENQAAGSGDAGHSDSDDEIEVDPAAKKRPPRKPIDPKVYKKKKPRKSISLPRVSAPSDWKTMVAVATVATALGLLSYQLYHFGQGPSIQVRENLD